MAETKDPVFEELKSLRAQIDKQSIQLDYLQQYQKVLLDVGELKHDVDRKWNIVKIGAPLVLAVAGAIGIHTFSDITKTVQQQIDADVEAQRKFYGDLMAGTALTIQKNYAAAIPKLMKCLDEKHMYDKSVLIPLLEAINITDDWSDAEPVLKRLRSDPQKFDQINDATVYRVIGAIDVQLGLSRRSKGQAVDGSAGMDQGFSLLKRALAIAGETEYGTRVHIYNNFWIYHIANGETRAALEDVRAIERFPEDAKVWSWSNMLSWQCMKDFAASNDKKSIQQLQAAAQQWKMLEKRYIKE